MAVNSYIFRPNIFSLAFSNTNFARILLTQYFQREICNHFSAQYFQTQILQASTNPILSKRNLQPFFYPIFSKKNVHAFCNPIFSTRKCGSNFSPLNKNYPKQNILFFPFFPTFPPIFHLFLFSKWELFWYIIHKQRSVILL